MPKAVRVRLPSADAVEAVGRRKRQRDEDNNKENQLQETQQRKNTNKCAALFNQPPDSVSAVPGVPLPSGTLRRRNSFSNDEVQLITLRQ